MDGCPFTVQYSQEKLLVDALRHWQNKTPMWEPQECPNWIHEGISVLANIEAADFKRLQRNG